MPEQEHSVTLALCSILFTLGQNVLHYFLCSIYSSLILPPPLLTVIHLSHALYSDHPPACSRCSSCKPNRKEKAGMYANASLACCVHVCIGGFHLLLTIKKNTCKQKAEVKAHLCQLLVSEHHPLCVGEVTATWGFLKLCHNERAHRFSPQGTYHYLLVKSQKSKGMQRRKVVSDRKEEPCRKKRLQGSSNVLNLITFILRRQCIFSLVCFKFESFEKQ